MSDLSDSDIDDVDDIDSNFQQAADHIQHKYSEIVQSDLLEIYGLYKQATVGRCNTEKPGLFNMKLRAKWNAWNDLGDMCIKEAKQKYVQKVQLLYPKWDTDSIIKTKGKKSRPTTGWVVHSTETPPIDFIQKAEHENTVFDYVKDGNLDKFIAKFNVKTDLTALDENGMGLIHWATDRNHPNILKFLLKEGVDVNLRDTEEQTALHYAVCCGNLLCLRLLLDANADRHAKDANGQTCYDVAESAEVRATLDL